jgi:hypothetical protein
MQCAPPLAGASKLMGIMTHTADKYFKSFAAKMEAFDARLQEQTIETPGTPAASPGHVSETPVVTALMQHIIDKHKAGIAAKSGGQRPADHTKGGTTSVGRRRIDGVDSRACTDRAAASIAPSAEAAAAAAAEALASLGITPIKKKTSVLAGQGTALARPGPGQRSLASVDRASSASCEKKQSTVSAMKTAQAAAAQAAAAFALQSAMAPASDSNNKSTRTPPSRVKANVQDGAEASTRPPTLTEPGNAENVSGKVCGLWQKMFGPRGPHDQLCCHMSEAWQCLSCIPAWHGGATSTSNLLRFRVFDC